MAVYYNENNAYCAQWLRNLIAAGHLPAGDVDERSIEDVQPDDLAGYDQCHFFAGIGGWPYALRLAGVPDDVSVWTGSCPCQPFSTAGKQRGTEDERHLWPVWYKLINQCRPAIVFGEQVASRPALAWLDAVFDDLENAGYACAAANLCAAGVGAPHIRQRLYWVAYSNRAGLERWRGNWKCSDKQPAWQDCVAIACRDGKSRISPPPESGILPMDDGLPTRMGCTCTQCHTETMIYEGMYFLRKIPERENRPEHKEILRQRVLSFASSVNEYIRQERHAQKSAEVQERQMRTVRQHIEATRSSHRQESDEQHRGQFTNSMLCLPSQGTCQEHALNVCRVWKAIQGCRPQESEQDLFCPVCERVGAHLCKTEMVKSRAEHIRAYGNAIVPQVAAEFVKAALHACERRLL